jgi:hypothetical protein
VKPSIETIAFHGLEALRLRGPGGSSAVISRLGGQVLSWITPDGRERLFLSGRAVFDGSVADPRRHSGLLSLGGLPPSATCRTLMDSCAPASGR